MFKITPQELHELLFEELPDVTASSDVDVSDFEDEAEVSTSIDKTINNNFDRTFNDLIELQQEHSLVSEENNEEVGLVSEEENDIDDPEALNDPETLNEPVGNVGLVQDEPAQNDDTSLDTSELVYDAKINSLPGPSKTKPKSKRKSIPKPDKTHKIKGAKTANKLKPDGKKGNSKGGKENKPSKRQIEERARAWKKKPTCLPETPYDVSEGKITF